MEIDKFLSEFVALVMPLLDTTEQAIYLYTIRHSVMHGKENVLISISSAAKRNAFGIGSKGGTMGISATRTKVYSLQTKGFVNIVDSTHRGLRVKPILPWDHSGIKRTEEISEASTPLEKLDFYSDPALRRAIRERENNRCFYSFQKITDENFVLDHILSRPQGNNSYMNIVATTKSMNNKKGNMKADDFLRLLYRDGLLSESDLTDRLQALEQLMDGELKPQVSG